MSRLNHTQLQALKERLGVSNLWSFSKISTYTQCKELYKLQYVDKIRVNSDSCYTYWGSLAHEIYQDFTDGKYKFEDMINIFEDKALDYIMADDEKLRFPAVKNSTSEDQRDKYLANLRHFFQFAQPLPYKITSEKFVVAQFQGKKEKYAVQGYIDGEYIDDDGNFVILDYKTSSSSGFTGAKLIEKSRQLMIYAVAISQLGRVIDGKRMQFPLDKIRIMYNMLKYCTITYPLKTKDKFRETKAERRVWVAKIAGQIRKDLLALDVDPLEIDGLIEKAVEDNNLDCMPQEIIDKYVVTDCYIEVPINEEVIEKFTKELIADLDEIVEREAMEDKEEAFARGKIDMSESYFCDNLCQMKAHCPFYQEYKQNQGMFIKDKEEKQKPQSDEDVLAMLGL